MADLVGTHDPIHPARERAGGLQPWVWPSLILFLLVILGVVIATIFTTSGTTSVVATVPRSQSGTGAAAQGAPAYSGRAQERRDDRADDPAKLAAAAQSSPLPPKTIGSPGSGSGMLPAGVGGPLQTAVNALANVPSSIDVSEARRGRVMLPALAGDTTATRGFVVVYDASAAQGASAAQPGATPMAERSAGPAASTSGGGAVFVPAVPVSVGAAAPSSSGAGGNAAVSRALEQAMAAQVTPYRREPPSARTEIAAGSHIDVQLDGAIDSTLAGPVSAHTVTDLHDALTGDLLIPAGSTLIGHYEGATLGASRLGIAWTRLTFPDRSYLVLDAAPALDAGGQTGLAGKVDDHRGKVIRTTLLGSLLGAGAAIAAGPVSVSGAGVVGISAGQAAGQAVGQQIMGTANRLINADVAEPPTIIVPANVRFLVYVDRDIPLAPYVPMPATRP